MRLAYSALKDNCTDLLQLSGQRDVFLIDLFKLKKNEILDRKLSEIFTNPSSTVIAFSFCNDMKMFFEGYIQLNFMNNITKLLDIQEYHRRVFEPETEQKIGLATIVKDLTGKILCKAEKMSNW
jgi:ribonuclease D